MHGSNKHYIEQTIPHISGLMKRRSSAALEDAELVVVAKRSPEFEEAIARLDGDAAVIDLASMRADFRQERVVMKASVGRVLMLVENYFPKDTRVRNEAFTLAAHGFMSASSRCGTPAKRLGKTSTVSTCIGLPG